MKGKISGKGSRYARQVLLRDGTRTRLRFGVDQGCQSRTDFKFDLYIKQGEAKEDFIARRS